MKQLDIKTLLLMGLLAVSSTSVAQALPESKSGNNDDLNSLLSGSPAQGGQNNDADALSNGARKSGVGAPTADRRTNPQGGVKGGESNQQELAKDTNDASGTIVSHALGAEQSGNHSQGATPTDPVPVSAGVVTAAAATSKTAKLSRAAAKTHVSTSRMIEEIVVTAERREENVQDVPEAITAFSAGKLEALGIKTVEDLPSITPGLTITNEVGFNVAFLRGVGTDAFLPGADSSVPFYIDGVPLLGIQGSSDTLGRIKRIEVLKGPQGTLFGTNSVGGAINIITPDPTNDFNGDIKLGYGNYNAKQLSGYVNVPITDHLAGSLSAFANKQKNFYTNDVGSIIGVYSLGGRLKLRWEINDQLTNTFSSSYQQISGNGGLNFELTRPAPFLSLVLPADPKADRHYSLDAKAGAATNAFLFADTIDWKLPVVEVKAIGSAQRLHAHAFADFDQTPLPIISADTPGQHSDQYTGELQFLSAPDTPLSDYFTWVGGFFYIYSKGGFDPVGFIVAPNALNVLAGTSLGGALTNLLNPITKVGGIDLNDGVRLTNNGVLAGSSLAAYFQGTVKLADSLNLILGGRFQHTHRDLEGSRTAKPLPGAPGGEIVLLSDTVPTLHANQFSPRVGLQWRPFGPDSQIYASWARGYKSPTYNTLSITGSVLRPINPVIQEKVNSYEIGFKSELFDHTLQLDAAAFYTREKDLLTGFISILTGGIVAFDTTPAARIQGLEGDAVWTPLPELDPGFVLTASTSYIDARYTDFPNARGYDTTTGLPFGTGFPVPPLPARNVDHNRIVRTPNLTYNASVSQTLPLYDGSLELEADGSYSSGFFFLPQDSNLYAQMPHYLLNAHVTYTYTPLGAEITLWGKNLTQTTYDATQFISEFGRSELLNDPRTYGVTLKWSF